MEHFTIKKIADELGADAFGDLDLVISAVNSPSKAGLGELALAMDPSYENDLISSTANAAIIWSGADWKSLGLIAGIIAPRSRYTLSGVTHLFEKKPIIKIYGNNYNTSDGTTIRDYIHVSDLANIHLEVLRKISAINKSKIINCGYGRGTSVLEVVNAFKKQITKKIKIKSFEIPI